MKTTICEAQAEKSIGFPKLMINPLTGDVILAACYLKGIKQYGTLIHAGDSNSKLGTHQYFSTDFVDFNGSITLSNDY